MATTEVLNKNKNWGELNEEERLDVIINAIKSPKEEHDDTKKEYRVSNHCVSYIIYAHDEFAAINKLRKMGVNTKCFHAELA